MKIDSQRIELMAAKKGMTVSSVADLMNMSRQNFAAIRSKGKCKAVTVVKIARALGCDPEEIIISEDA